MELFQGPILAPGRITSLAGATAAAAESLEGVYNNAAAPAVREAHSVDHFEWEPTAGVSLPGAYGHTDFDNRGEKGLGNHPGTVETTDRFLYLNAGLWGQLGEFGITLTADTLQYTLASQSKNEPNLNVSIARFHAVAAYGFFDNQLCVGGGVRMAYLGIAEANQVASGLGSITGNISNFGSLGKLISMFGVAPEFGMIVKPEDKQFRVGITARFPVSAASNFGITSLIQQTPVDGGTTSVRKVGTTNFVAPSKVVQPWEVEFGVAYQLGPRPLNPKWIDPHDHQLKLEEDITRARAERVAEMQRQMATLPADTPIDKEARARKLADLAHEEAATRQMEDTELRDAKKLLEAEREARYLNWPRERVLLLASVLMTGNSDQAVALEGFINQERELVGQRVTAMPRFGVESEAIPNLLKTRAGIYVEPSRFSDGTAREHFTVGLDVRLFQWDVFGLFPHHQWNAGAFADWADRYQNFGIGVGTWH